MLKVIQQTPNEADMGQPFFRQLTRWDNGNVLRFMRVRPLAVVLQTDEGHRRLSINVENVVGMTFWFGKC